MEGAEEPTFRLAYWAPYPWRQYVITWSLVSDKAQESEYWQEGPFRIEPEDTEARWTFSIPPGHSLTGRQIASVYVEFDGQRDDGESVFLTNTDGYVYYGDDGRLRYMTGGEAEALLDESSPDGSGGASTLVGTQAPASTSAIDGGE